MWLGGVSSIVTSALWFQITLNQEHKYMLSFAPDYDHLPLIAKVEVFEYALQNTEGNDLSRVCIQMHIIHYIPFFYFFIFPFVFPEYVILRFLKLLLIGTMVEKSHF